MKNILVTGAAGFIGANFAELMVKKYEGKYNIIVFDKLTYAGNIHNLDAIKDKITFVQGDICDFDFVMETYKKYDIDGARMNHMDGMGVLWGYGTPFEFIEAGAKFIAEKPDDIEAAALGFFEQTEEVNGIFSGRIFTVHEDIVMLADGTQAKRELVDHNGGVAVVPLTKKGKIIMVRQFRAPYKEIVYEIPAGKLEKSEEPCRAGLRELEEECGVTAEKFFELGKIYPTPGYCSEIIHIYGAVHLKQSRQRLDEGEFLEVLEIPLETAFEKCMSGEFRDAKTVIGIMKIREMKNNGSLS